MIRSIRNLSLLVCLVALSTFLFGQEDFSNWKQQQEGEYKAYKSADDKAFINFLEENWESFSTFLGEERDESPKPSVIPILEQKALEVIDSTTFEIIEPPTREVKRETLINSIIDEQKLENRSEIEVGFLGMSLIVPGSDDFKLELSYPVKNGSIAEFWYKISNSDYEPLLEQLQLYRQNMNLNDWGYCLLLHKTGIALSGDKNNLTKLFIWFMLTKSGYEMKVGYNGDNVYLLIPTKQPIFDKPYVKIDEKKYYIIDFEKNEKLKLGIQTYKGKHPDADDLIDLAVEESPIIKNHLVEKDFAFEYAGINHTITVNLDQSVAEFFQNYPQTNMEVYFQAPLSAEAELSLLAQLKPIIIGKSEVEAVNILLRFVQKAFPYKTDNDQFGYEKVMFQDEFLHYPFSDCEDRSIMFAYLVNRLVGLDVIGLDYPGHIATAVKFNTIIEGDTVVFNKEKYLICDPTYINANIGKSMPDFRKKSPKIINFL